MKCITIQRAPTFVFDGAGSPIAAGSLRALYFPFACTITASTMLAPKESGTIVVDLWKVALGSFPANSGNSIVASDPPTITAGQSSQDTTLTGWTLVINAGDTLTAHVNSNDTITNLTLTLTVNS